jgi:hypothetical protein
MPKPRQTAQVFNPRCQQAGPIARMLCSSRYASRRQLHNASAGYARAANDARGASIASIASFASIA